MSPPKTYSHLEKSRFVMSSPEDSRQSQYQENIIIGFIPDVQQTQETPPQTPESSELPLQLQASRFSPPRHQKGQKKIKQSYSQRPACRKASDTRPTALPSPPPSPPTVQGRYQTSEHASYSLYRSSLSADADFRPPLPPRRPTHSPLSHSSKENIILDMESAVETNTCHLSLRLSCGTQTVMSRDELLSIFHGVFKQYNRSIQSTLTTDFKDSDVKALEDLKASDNSLSRE